MQEVELKVKKSILPDNEILYAQQMKDAGAEWVVYDLSGKCGAPVYLSTFYNCMCLVKTYYHGALTFPIETFLNMLREEVKNDD